MFNLPETNIFILEPVSRLYYFDRQDTRLPRTMTALDAWNTIMSDPQPLLKVAFRIRDAISSAFGVKQIGGFSGNPVHGIEVGEYLDFFRVEHIQDDCLVLTERDRHVDVMTCISIDGDTLSVTSSVCVHNLFGRVYMIPVGIAHRWIVRSMFRRLHDKNPLPLTG
ncbi:DUF2867 domain-containing protein [Pseudosulfitobacter koreensis]|uniref:DUF2867 domain-containing protein n=1 Tax=Pseudosulfitobacter koreensis TaxID=2968472 RepID=A0ABT1Z1N4_9RHOB|nr:DUF2867 domain-containing protein [Pseudosulfitobacter koreense]MCR8827032.1 DUF2867 domain-containing protein [Pseudosulfitobacter koreense]